jgi:hypothetical protein
VARHVERREAAQSEPILEARLVTGELDVREAPEERTERDLDLRARERGAEAEVHAAAERQRLYVGTRDVQPVRVGIARGVAIPGTQQGEDLLAGGNGHAADIDTRLGHSVHELRRAVVAQELVGEIAKQRRITPQQGELIGMLQETQQAVAEEVGGGLETRREQQRRERHQLIIGQSIATDLGREQLAEQVLPRPASLVRDQTEEVLPNRQLRSVGRGHLLVRRLHLEDGHEIAHEPAELLPVLHRDA